VLAGHHVVFTGRLASLSRKEARLLVSRLGGTPGDEVTARTTMLVVGAGVACPGGEGRQAGGDGDDEKSQKIQRAEAINQKEPGRVRIVPEDEFCDLAGVPSPGELRHQWFALRDILTMYPRLREDHLRYLRKWNLIQPALKTNAETYYAFPDLTVIRQVHAELEHGTPFRTALRLVQASREGQLRLDFSRQAAPAKVIGLRRPPAEPTAAPASSVDTAAAEEFFRDGSALDDGDPRKYEAASRAYRRALEIDPGLVPALINLANLHYAQDHLVEAELLYAQAIELEPDVFEAHFNLGNVYHDLGRLGEARACYENAVGLNEAYPEAHFYLAVTLEKLGLSGAARPHWRRYQQLAPEGEWVELAREFGDQ
jgi:Flp pilus assembly protein TadD